MRINHLINGQPVAASDYFETVNPATQEVIARVPMATQEELDWRCYRLYGLLPAGVTPKRHKAIETTDIMVQMVASGRGVAALPRWLVEEYAARMDVVPVRLGARGIAKQIFLGAREADTAIDYVRAFVELARQPATATTAIAQGAKG